MRKHGRGHGALISLDDAQARIRAHCSPLAAESVPLGEAHGRILAAPIKAARDLPASDISMMDGYALRSADAPGPLNVAFAIAAGDAPSLTALLPGQAARIFTGAPVPPGADCVAMQEHTTREGDQLLLQRPANRGQHVRGRGEEMRAGSEVLARGARLGAAELSLAAGAGAVVVQVHARPRVAILATGDELIPLGQDPKPGQLVETNSLALAQLCREAGAIPILLGIAGDAPQAIADQLKSADADVLVTTGGASVGDHDHAQEAVTHLGGTLVFHGLAVRPGKPALFGLTDGLHANDHRLHPNDRPRLVFGLPGNPAASMLCFELLVRPALRTLQGLADWNRPRAIARLNGSLARVPGLTFFPRGRAVYKDGQLEFTPSGQQSSMQIGSWSHANSVAVIEAGEGRIESGALIEALLLHES
jgi:molybdopterin molybdotransferase